MKRFWILLTALMLLCSCAFAQETEQAALTTVTAVGSASVTAQADSAVLTFTITAQEETLAEAESKAAASASSLKYALLSAGAQAGDISLVRSDVQIEQKYQYNKLQEPGMEIVGRSVVYTMTAAVTQIDKLQALIDAAVLNGQYTSYETALASSALAQSRLEAVSLAAKDALARAEALAKACGFAKTQILSVRELPCEDDGLTVHAQAEVTLGILK